MSRSTNLLRRLKRQSKAKPPFLNPREIKDLAERLHTSQYVVATVLQVAGHVLRERYRRRGWLPRRRSDGDQGEPGTARQDVIGAFREVLGASGYIVDGPERGDLNYGGSRPIAQGGPSDEP